MTPAHARAIARLGTDVALFQEASSAFDDLAAEVLAIERRDVPCLTRLLFGGAASVAELTASLERRRGEVLVTVDRLERAGYARRQSPAGAGQIELTEHARIWIERIWAPLRDEGAQLLASYPARDLARMSGFMARAQAIQARQAGVLRSWLAAPRSLARRPHLRGGLSPAALHRVRFYVEAALERPVPLADLAARAGLSVHHFARAFRISTGETPRAFVEARRIERAKALIERSDRPLAEVAIDTGFSSQSRLTTCFKRRTGFTPAEYRRGRRHGSTADRGSDRAPQRGGDALRLAISAPPRRR